MAQLQPPRHDLATFFTTSLHIILPRIRLIETNVIKSENNNPSWVHLRQAKVPAHLSTMKLNSLTFEQLPTKNLRVCIRCNRLASQKKKKSSYHTNEWRFACQHCGGYWKILNTD